MPVDKHAKEGVSGVEVILTRLHAGAKFSEKSYRYSGGLHGVGVSVVNALSKKLQVWVRRDGNEYTMTFADGKKKSELKVVGTVGKRNTGTTVRFWPDETFFDSPKFSRAAAQARDARQGGALAEAAHALHQRARSGRERGVVFRGRADGLPPLRAGGQHAPAGDAVQRPLQGARSRGGLGGGVAAGGGRHRRRELREPHPDVAGRHARQRLPHRAHRSHPRVLRVPQPAAARREARAGGRLGALQLHPLACA